MLSKEVVSGGMCRAACGSISLAEKHRQRKAEAPVGKPLSASNLTEWIRSGKSAPSLMKNDG